MGCLITERPQHVHKETFWLIKSTLTFELRLQIYYFLGHGWSVILPLELWLAAIETRQVTRRPYRVFAERSDSTV